LRCGLLIWLAMPGLAWAQLIQHPDPSLDSIYPAGAQPGQSLQIELRGLNGLSGATGLVIDGPPGVMAADVKAVDPGLVTATLHVAADAPPGRRRIRVLGGANGLTNFRSFFVGTLPEIIEAEGADGKSDQVDDVAVPTVINARLTPALDVDAFRFEGRAGQKIVAAVLAHGMATLTRQGNNRGFLDTSLELQDEAGSILATAEDSIGLDPLIHFTLPADGRYTVIVRSLSFQGFPQAVYRLTLGETPYPIGVFPPGGRRGESVDVRVFGPNVPDDVRQTIAISSDSGAVQDIAWEGAPGVVLPFLRGDYAETLDGNSNRAADSATIAPIPSNISGRLAGAGEEDWYRLHLEAGQGITAEITSQRHFLSPIDTELELRSVDGQILAQNDDGLRFSNECLHDFASQDSRLSFTAVQTGDYDLIVRDLAQSSDPRSIYRLTIEPRLPDFQILQWPDAVPVWGAGGSAAFVVQLLPSGGLNADVELSVLDLPEGWTGSTSYVPGASFVSYNDTHYGIKALLTITAPPDAAAGSLARFRVIGRAAQDGRSIEHIAQPLSLLGNSHNDRMHLRFSPESYAVVAAPLDARIATSVTQLSVVQGQSVEIPVTVVREPGQTSPLSLNVDGQTVAASCAWRSPFSVPDGMTEIRIPLEVSTERTPGRYSIVVSRSWSSDLRGGRPGPCTPLIELVVLPPAQP
jgi:hypothetical protein